MNSIKSQPLNLFIPILGLIAAGYAEEQHQENSACPAINLGGLAIKPTRRIFALQIWNDAMIGRHIVNGDVMVLKHGRQLRHGDVVAALIDNQPVLRTAIIHQDRLWLREENSPHPKFVLADGFVSEGVMTTLIRRLR